jgi:hypothetical protein
LLEYRLQMIERRNQVAINAGKEPAIYDSEIQAVAQLSDTLTRATQKLVELERKTYNLDAAEGGTPNAEGEIGDVKAKALSNVERANRIIHLVQGGADSASGRAESA